MVFGEIDDRLMANVYHDGVKDRVDAVCRDEVAMFDGMDAARKDLGAYFAGDRLSTVLAALVPALVFEPAPGTVPGGTRLGGAPDLALAMDWPRPPAPADPEAIAGRGNQHAAAEMREHLARGLPYAFVAQVDLAEATGLGGAAADLPGEGRLLFFYDFAVGPWETGSRPARVVWDRSPRENLVRAPVPEDLAAADAREQATMAEVRAQFKRAAPAHAEGTVYGAPGRAMRLRPVLRLPHLHALEMAAIPALEALSRGRGGDAAVEAFNEDYEAAIEDLDGTEKAPGRRQQLLGSPHAEQDDPRYDAVIVTTFGTQHLSREDWRAHQATVEARATEWRLLLQLDLADWMRADLTEGSVYFLIRRDDLAARRFDAVVAVYQQT